MPAKAITIAQQKGGAGKTTIAAQLAVAFARAGKRVGLLDIDPQGSLAAWFDIRKMLVDDDGAGITFIQASGWRLTTELDRMKKNVDVILIDSPPHAETDARVAIRAASLVLVPMQPSVLDLWATRPTLDLVQAEKRQALIVFNRLPSRSRAAEDVVATVQETGIPVARSVLGNRVALAAALAMGQGIGEFDRSSAAFREISQLAGEILSY